jgi:hypothetical protein
MKVAHLAGIPQPLERESFKQFGMTFYLGNKSFNGVRVFNYAQ